MPPPGTCRRLEPSNVTAHAALARAVDALASAEAGDPPTVAWSLVDGEVLVLGRGSRVQPDAEACRAAGVGVTRRSSGGGPVLWGPDLLALDVVVPSGHPRYTSDVAASYRWLGEALAAALAALGVPAVAVPPGVARRLDSREVAERACFAGCSPWEVLAGGRKMVGLSQVRRQPGTLLQAGILLRHRPDRLPGLLALDPADRASTSAALADRAVGLDAYTAATAGDVIGAVERALAAEGGGGATGR